MRLLVPKAQAEQERWQQELTSSQTELNFVDPWILQPLPETPEMRTAWLNIDRYTGVICVSSSAAEVLVDALDKYWPMAPVDCYWLCNGPRTAEVLINAGLKATFPASGFTAEDVLKLPQTKVNNDDNWLVVKGEDGRVTYDEVLSERGATVKSIYVYRRTVNYERLAEMKTMAAHCDAIWLSSKFLGEQLLSANGDFWRQWPGQWWLSSARLADWAHQSGLQTVKIGTGATPDALQTMIETV